MATNSDNNLTVEQRTVLGRVKKYADDYRTARESLYRQLLENMHRELAALQAQRDNETRVAYALGVKKSSLKRALGSKDHATLQNILTVGGTLLMPEQSMVEVHGDSFTINFVDYQGERVYGRVECVRFVNDGVTVGFDMVSYADGDLLAALVDSTTAAGDMTVYEAIVHAVG